MLTLNFTPFPTIYTERLVLRAPVPDDAQDWFRMRSDEQVRKYLGRAKQSLEEVEELLGKVIANFENNEAISWMITLKGDTRLIGDICFWRIKKEHFRAEVGYSLSPEYWGKGYVPEALRAILAYAFGEMKLHSVEATITPGNNGSARVLEKNGFVQEAYFKEDYFFEGEFWDSAVYSLLKANFRAGLI